MLDSAEAGAIFAALAQPWRLETFRLLIRYLPYGLAAGDISRLMALPHNTLSAHLAILERAGLIRSRREGRSIIFAAVRERALQLSAFLAEGCCGVTNSTRRTSTPRSSRLFPVKREVLKPDKIYKVLILCAGNSARSIIGEALLNREGYGRFHAFSAGSRPKRKPNPQALLLLKDLGYETEGFRSKSWKEFADAGAPAMDFIVTVCDSIPGETCPHWPGHPLVVHWGVPDPVAVGGAYAEKRAAFRETYRRLSARVSAFVNLDVENLDLSTLKGRLAEIGGMEGATELTLRGLPP